MKSLGVIETRGWVAAIQAVDAACKAAGVTCIGYRKPGSGLVSVCFEGEISAIHTAIERGVAVAGAEHTVKSLVIARPERCVVEALSNLKGNPPRAKQPSAPAAVAVAAAPEAIVPSAPQAAPQATEDKNPTLKKGKK
ncbi:TPA: BMC domain-containing protein [Klebsiella variicola]|uniref:BMC domain-containing protein n=20 Tax=Enterobacterales TaxID=91347 RepID=UPI0014029A96|nr:BMC domain-containing protein [Klebsiella variicola]HCI9593567.1 BMC domain-containing protein [Klebsiella variicola]